MQIQSPMSKQKTLVLYIAFWAFCVIAQFFLLRWMQFDFKHALIDAKFSMSSLALGAFITNRFYRFYQPGKKTRYYRLLWGVALAFGCVAAQYYFLSWFFKGEAAYLVFLEQSLPVRFLFALIIIAFITVISWLLSSIKEQQENENRKADAENLSKEAELARLRLQLQPHFLFNSLNSVNALIKSNPDEARTMIQELSDFMRSTLKNDDALIFFEEELNHLQLYLNIEKVRFGHRLILNMDVEENCKTLLLPPLLLQPVVENAIKFGLYNTTGNVEIKVIAKNKNGSLEIITENPYDAETASAKKGTGFGLSSIQRRLYLLFGRNDLLKIFEEQNVFRTVILIPQLK